MRPGKMVGRAHLPGGRDRRSPAGSSPARRRSGLDRAASQGHIAAMLIRTEQTPNPATRKFLPGPDRHGGGHPRFRRRASQREASPLAAGPVRQRHGRRRLLRPRLHLRDGGAGRVVDATSSRWCSRPCSTISSATRRCSRPARAAGIHVAGRCRLRRRPGRRRHHRPDQGTDRNPRPPGGRPGWRRHRLQGLSRTARSTCPCTAPAPAARRRRSR